MHRQPRRGTTLTEVLVAIFICGLGLMALMTLFPLGAFNMAQALEDDRCGHAGANGAAILRMVWRQALETGGQTLAGTTTTPDPNFLAFQGLLAGGPVYIDPIGMRTGAGGSLGGIPRVNLGCLQFGTLYDSWKWCALLDDIEFEPIATPRSPIPRNLRYSWAWMVRPIGSPPYRALAFSVVVYHNRSMMGSGGRAEYPLSGSFDMATNRVTVSGGSLPIRKGTWILDAFRAPNEGGYFYRVTKVENGVLSVQPAVRRSGGGSIIVMDNVAEVFERTTLE